MIPAIQEVNFPSYATLHQATVTLQEMGDRVISTQVRIDGDVVPDFSGWELFFKGERFILPSTEPQASKDNTTRNSIIDLQFQSWVIHELKRYFFFEATSINSGTAIADKYKASVRLSIEDFIPLLNKVLNYYFDGTVVASLYLSGSGIYSTDRKDIEIDYSYLWEVIGKVYEVYDVRNRIEYDSTTGVYTILFGYPAPAITDHDFEYGYQGGLVRFERQVQEEDIHNILLGRGGEKNLPYRYFKKIDEQNPDWAADPDAIPELANIYFDRLRDINFRWYVRGWVKNENRDTSADTGYTLPDYDDDDVPSDYLWAYQKGRYEDTKFNPVEYVKDDTSIAEYGEHWGALDDNDDIFPTIQGRSRSPLGRIDEVVAVSSIVTDDIQAMASASAVERSISPLLVSSKTNRTQYEIYSEEFTIPTNTTGNITYAWLNDENSHSGNVFCDTVNTTLVAVSSSTGTEVSISGIPSGTYRLKLNLVISINSPATVADGTFGIENIVLTTSAQDADAWKPTFDIWVKNIWGTTKGANESDAQYAARVWEPILGDRVGNESKIVFSDGFMSVSEDYEFQIVSYPTYDTSKSIDGVSSEWKITLRKSDAEFDTTGLYIPNATSGGRPLAGDHFYFIGIDMPFLYVTLAEEDLNTYKEAQLDTEAQINPTWVINLDKVRVHTLEDQEYGQTLADRLAAGATLRITDSRFSLGQVLTLHAQSITYTWNEPTDDSPYIVPDIEVVLTDEVTSSESRIDKIQSSITEIKSQYARLDDVATVVRSVAEPLFLKKTGESDSSSSPTQFASKVTSKGFRQGGVGGTGWGFYRDNTEDFANGKEGEGDAVLELDRVIIRKELQVNNLVVNQIDYRGGMEIISAAQIEASKVVETSTGYDVYFDQKQNSVANNFVVGDIAYGQVFSPENVSLRYYKCVITAVDVDRITLSKTLKDGSGVPADGDIIVQYGNISNSARQYVIVRDVIGGGYERMLSGLDAVDSDGDEYYFAGRQSGQNPRWFVGDIDGEYAQYQDGVLNIKGRISVRKSDGTYIAMNQYIADNDMQYLKSATNQGTLVDGGLVLTSLIQLGQTVNNTFNVYSGINGIMDSTALGNGIAAWYGGPMVDHEDDTSASSYAKTLFRFDGSGYLANGNISWDEYGVVSLSGNVTINGNRTLAYIVSSVSSFLSWFEVLTDNNGNRYLHAKNNLGIVSDSYVSAGGLSSSGSGSSGISLTAVWNSLTNSIDDGYNNTQISADHLTNYYTKAQVNTLVSSIPRFAIEVVSSLPTSDISPTTVYLLRNTETTGSDLYEEYIYVNSTWELLGTAKVDLSGYLPLSGGTMSNTNVVTNLNADLLDGKEGTYYYNVTAAYDVGATSADDSTVGLLLTNSGTPTARYWFIKTDIYNAKNKVQVALPYKGTSYGAYMRSQNNSTWTDWRQFAFTDGTVANASALGNISAANYWHTGNLSLASLAGSTAIGSSTTPIYYNGSALAACDLSTTYAPYNSAGYLPLTGGTMSNTNVVTNLNADLLDGKEGTYYYNVTAAYDTGITSADDSTVGLLLTSSGTPTARYWFIKTDIYNTKNKVQVALPYQRTSYGAYMRAQNNSTWTDWREFAFTDGTVANASALGNISAANYWHTGNSGTTSYNWNAKNLTLAGALSGATTGNFSSKVTIGEALVVAGSTALSTTLSVGSYIYLTNEDSRIYVNLGDNGNKCALRCVNGSYLSLGQGTYPYFDTRIYGSYLRFYTYYNSTNVETMRILSNGNIGMGTTSPAYKLDVSGVIHATTGIFTEGYVNAGGLSSSSDARLKDNILSISYVKAIDMMMRLNGCEWDWNNKNDFLAGKHGSGLVAQDVLGVMPWAVTEQNGEYSLNYNTLWGIAIPVMKSHEERIKALEAENRELRSIIEKL